MKDKQENFLEIIRSTAEKLSSYRLEYWQTFQDLTMWQIWFLFLMLLVPLVVLFMYIDKRKALLLGFFGMNYHLWFSYTNTIGISLGFWEYPYQLIPFVPSFTLDGSFIPVVFMLVYQWTLNRGKNIYLYAVLLSAINAFVLKPILVQYHFFSMFKGVNYIHLFLFYLGLFMASKLITDLFVWLQRKAHGN